MLMMKYVIHEVIVQMECRVTITLVFAHDNVYLLGLLRVLQIVVCHTVVTDMLIWTV